MWLSRKLMFGTLTSLMIVGCAGDGDGDSDGGGDSGASEDADPGDACHEIVGHSWNLRYSSGPSTCQGFGDFDCQTAQAGCDVTIECASIGGSATVPIGSDGVTGSMQVGAGDGVTATCHAEFTDDYDVNIDGEQYDVHSMVMICNAQGVTCEFGDSEIFDPGEF